MSDHEDKNRDCKLNQFQRNNYFYGKLMTVRDFEVEQDYFNGKRHLLNRYMYGPGLVCGFSHIEVSSGTNDEVKVKFSDGGVALDSCGREIVVPVDMDKIVINEKSGNDLKRSDIEETMYLYLRYKSYPSELVNAASSPLSCEEVTCENRVLEDFEIIASNKYPKPAFSQPENTENISEESNKKGWFDSTSRSCSEIGDFDDKVFFVAVNEDISVNRTETSRRNFVSIIRSEGSKKNIATGVVLFERPTVNTVSSDLIDPRIGTGPSCIKLGLEKDDEQILTGSLGILDRPDIPKVLLGADLDPDSGRFRVTARFQDDTERTSIKIRWWAFKADLEYGMETVKSATVLTKYKFADDPMVKAKVVEHGLCESGGKNCMEVDGIRGGDHYAKVGNDVALNGNPQKLVELIKEQDDEVHELYDTWDIGGRWLLKVEEFDLSKSQALVKLYYNDEELKKYAVSEGDLITYFDDIAGEQFVPLFISYVDKVSIPKFIKEAKVELKYTWAVAREVRTIE
ncbi:hypothetical protein V7O66_04715 [Methanolobus sp. ZRKC3]|uniref:hypothetical protein n=1 Tax=Methanolobus sp. ZRKC3 TaxID=3125786 RepID=UPI0032494670